ncbi:hypothetical protein Pelo_16930 [Pelomyxa schiedti]|nr:hypothetical protein Pelo_16930 [Pelomyxa schiedti]
MKLHSQSLGVKNQVLLGWDTLVKRRSNITVVEDTMVAGWRIGKVKAALPLALHEGEIVLLDRSKAAIKEGIMMKSTLTEVTEDNLVTVEVANSNAKPLNILARQAIGSLCSRQDRTVPGKIERP